MFPLRRGLAVFGSRGPLICWIDDSPSYSNIDHGFDCKSHSRSKKRVDLVVVVGDLWRLVELDANSMAHKLIDDRTSLRRGIIFYSLSNMPDRSSWLTDGYRSL